MSLVLQASHIKKQYGIRTILDFEELSVYEGDKIGVVGLNGAGKTTLLEILSGSLAPDSGQVTCKCRRALIRQFEENDSTLSGGENVKKRINRELAGEDTIIFADEPTANLDSDGVNWVRQRLQEAGTVLLISHDRQLLDDVCTRIVEVTEGRLQFYTGNYTDYQRFKEEAERHQAQKYSDYQRKRSDLEAAAEHKIKAVARLYQSKKKQYAKNGSEARLGGHKRAANIKKVEHERKIIEARLERLEKVERVREQPGMRIDFSLTNPPGNKIVLRGEGLSFSYGSKVIFSNASFSVKNGSKAAITGKNGAGKTTLLRCILEGNPAITAAPKLRWGYLHQTFDDLKPDWTVLENAMGESIQEKGAVRAVLAGLLFFGDDVFKPASVLSGGEKIRLSLARLVVSRCNALMLDEPTNYLDIHSIEAVQGMVKEYPGTVLLVSHDERFVKETASVRLQVSDGKIIEQPVQEERPAPKTDRLVLELRRTQLAGAISSAPAEEKDRLEAEYNSVIEQLRNIG